MKTFKQHLMESDKEYHYRIKTIVECDDEFLSRLESLVQKYELRDISAPRKTILQDHPLDFYDIQHAEVTIIDIVTGVPASGYVLQQEIRANLKVPEKYIIVRGANDPLEIENDRRLSKESMDQEAASSDMERSALLSTESGYPEVMDEVAGSDLFGNDYNKKFLDTLAQVAANRKPEYVENKGDGIFNWLNNDVVDAPEVMTDDSFNDDHDYAPRPVPWYEASSIDHRRDKSDDLSISEVDNVDDEVKTYTGIYKKVDGEEKVLSRKVKGIREDG